MSCLNRMSVVAAMCGLVICILGSSGCVNLEKKFPDIRTYSLDLSQQSHLTYDGIPVSVRLSDFSAVPVFSDRYLTYRTSETAYEQDFYNQLMAAPARMVQDEFFAWMKTSPLISFILPGYSAQTADFNIEGKLMDLSGDYRLTPSPKAIFEIQFTVSRLELGNSSVVFQKMYSAEIPIQQPSPKMLTEGWITGFGQVMTEFENDFKELVSNTDNA